MGRLIGLRLGGVVLVSLALGGLLGLTLGPVAPRLAAQATGSVGWFTDTLTHTLYIPLVTNFIEIDPCAPIPGTSYGQLGITNAPTERPAADHPDMNLAIRGYAPIDAPLTLVDYAGPTDARAPQLDTLFATPRLPTFTRAFQVHHWDWETMSRGPVITTPDVTLLGMAVNPGDTVHVPDSGYDIQYEYDALVLYASRERITLHYGREDHPGLGYVVHIEGICVEPSLLALYESLNAAGRWELPAVYGGQPIGRAWGDSIDVSIRDTGAFMDPRARKDWWKAH